MSDTRKGSRDDRVPAMVVGNSISESEQY